MALRRQGGVPHGRTAGGRYELRRHRVVDEGNDEFRDISAFSPVDEEEEPGEGVTVGRFASPEDIVGAAAEHGGAADRWVSQALAADDYWRAKYSE